MKRDESNEASRPVDHSTQFTLLQDATPVKGSNRRAAMLRTVLCAALAGGLGCQVGDGESGGAAEEITSQTEGYSVLSTLSYSILREYDRAAQMQGANIRYPVCVTGESTITTTQRQNLMALEQRAINAWNDALKGQTGWRVQSIQLYLVGGATPNSCPTTSSDGLRVYRLIVLAYTDRGQADFYNYTNKIGRSEFQTGDVRREMHEYGHQIGMGDTYTEAGYEIPIGQPPSIMNLYYNVQGLTQDDIDGVRQIWTMIRTNSNNPCGPGYAPGQTQLNNNNHRFCVKTNGGGGGTTGGTTGGGQCVDMNTSCKSWASAGECTKNPGYMLTSCCASCKSGNGGGTTGGTTGGGQCVDMNASCKSWASAGECSKNPGYMLTSCCASCKSGSGGGTTGGTVGGQCTDTNSNCRSWASAGECSKNPGYMRTSCCASCKGR